MGTDRIVFAAAALLTMLLQSIPAAAQQRSYSVSGAVNVGNATGLENPFTLLRRPDVQAIITEALNGPIEARRLAILLQGSEVTLNHLLDTDVLAPAGNDRYRLATTVLTAEDRRFIDQVTDPLGRSLAEALLKERAAFDRILARYDLAGIDLEMVRMALIGCVILDWDGLGVTAAGGYRTPPVLRPNGARYQMALRENAPDVSARGLYWGSHSNQVADKKIWTTTFGDHHFGYQRIAFPDLTFGILSQEDMESHLSLASSRPVRQAVGLQLSEALTARMEEMQELAGPIMIALRNRPADAAALSAKTGQSPERMKPVLALLEALQYVLRKDDQYRAAIPVFTAERDGQTIREYRALGTDIMRRWLKANYDEIQRRFSGLASVRAGVPYKIVFTELWHPLFGWANYHLVKQGYLLDPYGPKSKFISFVPFVWDAPLNMEEGTKIFD